MHCDVSKANLMLRVALGNVDEAVPEWPGPGKYVKRAGVLSDWGLALPYEPKGPREESLEPEAWGVTVSIPESLFLFSTYKFSL